MACVITPDWPQIIFMMIIILNLIMQHLFEGKKYITNRKRYYIINFNLIHFRSGSDFNRFERIHIDCISDWIDWSASDLQYSIIFSVIFFLFLSLYRYCSLQNKIKFNSNHCNCSNFFFSLLFHKMFIVIFIKITIKWYYRRIKKIIFTHFISIHVINSPLMPSLKRFLQSNPNIYMIVSFFFSHYARGASSQSVKVFCFYFNSFILWLISFYWIFVRFICLIKINYTWNRL